MIGACCACFPSQKSIAGEIFDRIEGTDMDTVLRGVCEVMWSRKFHRVLFKIWKHLSEVQIRFCVTNQRDGYESIQWWNLILKERLEWSDFDKIIAYAWICQSIKLNELITRRYYKWYQRAFQPETNQFLRSPPTVVFSTVLKWICTFDV